MITDDVLFGCSEAHLIKEVTGRHKIHAAISNRLKTLCTAAKASNTGCDIVSGYRSFSRQLSIWERKWNGQTILRDPQGTIVNASSLTDYDKLQCILTWSALPGASRHHWGTDIDVYDKASVTASLKPFELIPEEYQAGGPCFALSQFLAQNVNEFGFHWPYAHYNGGIAHEPWHISFTDIAAEFEQALSAERYFAFLKTIEFSGKTLVLQHFEYIFHRYVLNKGKQQDAES